MFCGTFNWKKYGFCILLVILLDGSNQCCGKKSADGEESTAPQFKEAIFIYPPGIRSERDIPICAKWVVKTPPMENEDIGLRESPQMKDSDWDNNSPKAAALSSNYNDIFLQNGSSIFDILVEGSSVAQGNPAKGSEEGISWESACNIVHKRYFYPPIVERLCRCPDRTECPWEYSQPPPYPNSPVKPDPGTPKGTRDPFSIMLSSRSQAKFCTEVTTELPRCQNPKIKKGEIALSANLVKTVRRTGGGEEIPRVNVNCYCPPLFRQWNYVGHTEPTDFGNGTLDTNYYYRCERLPRCKRDDRCGNIRTDLHFSHYHCTCPQKHLCLPKIYPPESVDDVEEDVNEILFRGQVAPSYCTPYP